MPDFPKPFKGDGPSWLYPLAAELGVPTPYPERNNEAWPHDILEDYNKLKSHDERCYFLLRHGYDDAHYNHVVHMFGAPEQK